MLGAEITETLIVRELPLCSPIKTLYKTPDKDCKQRKEPAKRSETTPNP